LEGDILFWYHRILSSCSQVIVSALHGIDGIFHKSNYCYSRMHKSSKNLGATSKFKAPEGRHKFYTEDPPILGATE